MRRYVNIFYPTLGVGKTENNGKAIDILFKGEMRKIISNVNLVGRAQLHREQNLMSAKLSALFLLIAIKRFHLFNFN